MRFLRFPAVVDEISARLVATGVVTMAVLYLATGWAPLMLLAAYGFLARFVAGPRFSPLGLLVTKAIRPLLSTAAPRETAGPPKQFAQGIGAVFTVGASVAHYGFHAQGLALLLMATLVVAASLEAALGFCLGCRLFAGLMRLGLIPEATCAACANLSLRTKGLSAS